MSPVMPVSYHLVPNLYILCSFPQIPNRASFPSLPSIQRQHDNPGGLATRTPIQSGRHSLPSLQVRRALLSVFPWERLSASQQVSCSVPHSSWPLMLTAESCRDMLGPRMRNQWRERTEASRTFIKGKKVPWPLKGLSLSGSIEQRSSGKKGAGRRRISSFSWGPRWTNWQPCSQLFFPLPFVP